MYYLAVRQFVRSLKNLDALLEKAQQSAKARNFDVNNFCSMRLYPDMLPFVAQIRIACDTAKGTAAALAGKDNVKHEDNETTVEELRGRIGKCVAFLDTFRAEDFARTTPETVCKLGYPQGKGLKAEEFLFGRQLPNFYFHVVTAYDILRQGGVDLGKGDYLGSLDLIDA